MCQRAAHALSCERTPLPPTFNAVGGLASRRRLVPARYVAVLAQRPHPLGHVAAPDLHPSEGEVRAPGWPERSGPPEVRLRGVWAQDHPAGVRARGSRPRVLCPSRHVEAPDLAAHGEEVQRPWTPAVRPEPYTQLPRGLVRGYG